MTGKILGRGVIRGDDGQRYYYDDGELKNAKDGQSIDGCEVDFDIKDGKAIEIYIISTRDFSQDSNDDRDDEDDSDEEKSIFEDKDNKFFHKGIVSNYRKEVVSHTSGEISISGVRSLPSGHIEGGGGGGSVSTTHYHTTYFDIGNKSFAWEGSNPISNGDEVALCSTPMTNGYNYVECLKNTTKGLFLKRIIKKMMCISLVVRKSSFLESRGL